jgi:CheY-like chemotaxis protein
MTAASVRKPRVLLAEDDANARTILATILRAMDLDVVEVDDGGRMLVAVAACYRESRPRSEIDLVVTDVRMPVVSGIEIVKNIRRAGWSAPIIIVTGWVTPELEEAAKRYGGVLLPKPLDLNVFERTVRDLLDQRRAAG